MAKHRPLAERFFEKVEPVTESGCWLWIGGISNTGYGMIGVDAYNTDLAHRVSWVLHNGKIPDGLFVLHKCDVRACVNPNHLYVGTVKDNSRDLWARGKPYIPKFPHHDKAQEAKRVMALPRGAAHHRSAAKLTEKIVLEIFHADGSQYVIARKYGVCQQTVSLIKSKKRWSYLHG